MSELYWKIDPVDWDVVHNLSRSLHISDVMSSVLIRRGLLTPDQASLFLSEDGGTLCEPAVIPGMAEAVLIIQQALERKTRIAIYGDYDVDGICSTVILWECLLHLGAEDAVCYIPDRFDEGYGLNTEAIQRLAGQGVGLLITVDCGISSMEEAAYAASVGMDVVVTDHHTPGESLPAAAAVVNPKLGGPQEGADLCGAGVTYKLALELGKKDLSPALISSWLELVALATVADIVPLTGENRLLVKTGLEAMKKSRRLGLLALIEESRLVIQDLAGWHLGFVLAPRLNAAGRLASAGTAISLLITKDPQEARKLAQDLCRLNEERKRIEQAVFDEAACCVEQWDEPERQGILIIDGENWHHGVLGIAASRLAERYRRPVVLVSWEGLTGRGSARSVPGFNLYEALNACREWLSRFGGHAMAAGISITREQLDQFRKHIKQRALTMEPLPQPELKIDGVLAPEQITMDLAAELARLEPFGEGNPAPRFLIPRVWMQNPSLMGSKKEHYRALLQPGSLGVVGFRRAEWIYYPFTQCRMDVVAEIDIDTWQDRKRLRLKAVDMRPSYRNHETCDQGLTDLLDRGVKTLRSRQPVIFILPTCRLLEQFRHTLNQYFAEDLIRPLHGRLASEQRVSAHTQLTNGYPGFYLLTEAMWSYLSRSEQPALNSGLTVRLWPGGNAGDVVAVDTEAYPSSYPSYSIELFSPPIDAGKSALYYINHPHTRQRYYAEGISNADMTVPFCGYRESAAITDGLYLPSLPPGSGWPIVFADAPFSLHEAGSIVYWAQTGQDKADIKIAFDREQLDVNREILLELYPDRLLLRTVAAWLGQNGKKGVISGEARSLAEKISSTCSRQVSDRQLLACLHILEDLGLCHFRKKGSIMEIKTVANSMTALDLADSPYYLEGQGEKRAFAAMIDWINRNIAW